MLQAVIDLQNRAVEDLLNVTKLKNEIVFKAPTGSGKTYMMADYMNRVIANDPDVIFLVSSLSKCNLAEQNMEKFKEYGAENKFRLLNPYLISTKTTGEEDVHIPTNYNVYVLPRDLYKKNSKLMRGPLLSFLNVMTSKNLTTGLNKKIYLIKDECHIATNNLNNISNNYFKKVINFSATPNLKRGQVPDVLITADEAIKAKLIKSITWGKETDTLLDALCKYKEIKKAYLEKVGINPCFIIQISNKDKAEEELKNTIFPLLNSKDFNDLKWMLIVDKDKECDTNDVLKAANVPIDTWKKLVKLNNSCIDVVIFKTMITEGWDIPRACMLYQIRDTKSIQLDKQVIGRPLRNPCLPYFETLDKETQDLVTTAYIWGVSSGEQDIPVKIKEDKKDALKIMTTRLKRNDEKNYFDIKEFVDKQKAPLSYGSIFNLYRKFNKLDIETQQDCFKNIEGFSDWYKYADNSPKIQAEYAKYICNYEETMELTKDENDNIKLVSFPEVSTYNGDKHYLKIKNWIWSRIDGGDKFPFDSEAEKDFAEEIKDFILENSETKDDFIWGKNFLPNSEIRFEYYLDGIRSSYPDFILRDKYSRIHIFEVKSVNKSSSQNVDKEKYEEKVRALEECYKYAAVLTGHYFYLPIMNGSTWDVTKIEKDGNVAKVTRNLSIDTMFKQIEEND